MKHRAVKILVTTALAIGIPVTAAMAATSGAVYLSVSGAYFSGTYQYNAYVMPGVTGIRYSGTLANTSTADANDAHFYGRVSGYGWTEIGLAHSGQSVSVNSVLYDPAATSVNTSKAQVCRDRTLFPQNCSVGTYNR